jgi:hypothetical protein
MQRSAENTQTLLLTRLLCWFTVVEMGGEKQHFYPNPQKVSSEPGRGGGWSRIARKIEAIVQSLAHEYRLLLSLRGRSQYRRRGSGTY